MASAWYLTLAGKPVEMVSAASSWSTSEIGPQVHLSAASGASILFMTQNNQTIRGAAPVQSNIPHLVLSRNGELTVEQERTLWLSLTGLEVPTSGITVTVKLETQHSDPGAGANAAGIAVWNETRRIDPPPMNDAGLQTAAFTIQFDEEFNTGPQTSPTPTDYYRYEVEIFTGSERLSHIRQDYAFLLERQWTVPLSGITGGAGAVEFVVYACDMFPFQRSSKDPATRLPRTDVPGYIQNDLIPNMIEAVRMQTQDWGYSLDGWTGAGYNSLTVALSDGQTWYHGPAPERGHSGIAINANGGDNADYETLTEGLMSTFHHELFHIFQHSIVFANGGDGNFNGKDQAWRFFSEGLASFVSSAAQPVIQFQQSGEERAYIAKAIEYIGGRGFPGDLNNSYGEMDPYHAALYWRYLYEQCGGMSENVPNPGMRLIGRILQLLYGGAVVDVSTSTDLVGRLPAVMDLALSSPEASQCPFRTYLESLASFARAIYKLRLEGGRSSAPGSPASLYDPNGLYSTPRSGALLYSGAEIRNTENEQPYPAGIPSSYGMDFVEIQLSPKVQQQPVTVELHTDLAGKAVFDVQILYLLERGSGMSAETTQAAGLPVDILGKSSIDAHLSLTIPTVDLDQFNRLGVVITRVDSQEALDPVGAYTLVVRP